MRVLILAAAICLMQSAISQKTIDVTDGNNALGPGSFFTAGGTPFINEKYVKLVEGTPYFSNEWMKGMLVASGGQAYKDLSLKLNLHTNQVLYIDDKENEMVTTTSISEVILTDDSGNNYRFIHSSALPQQESNPIKPGWYQWLCSGTASLYKYYNKSLTESTPYGSATTEQKIQTKEKYLVNYNNSFLEIPKLKNAASILANKKTELEDFLKTKDDKKASTEDRYVAIVQYYNSLFTEK